MTWEYWSSTIQIKTDQTLVTQGIYKTIRHPIYTAHILQGLAQALMLPNWLVGWGALVLINLVFILRIPNQERTVIEQFGDEYLEYKKITGGLIPKFR